MMSMCKSYLNRYDKTIQISDKVSQLFELIDYKIAFTDQRPLERYLTELTNNQIIKLFRELQFIKNFVYENYEFSNVHNELWNAFSMIEEQIRIKHLYPLRFNTNYNDELKLFYLGSICDFFMKKNFGKSSSKYNIVIICNKKKKFDIEFITKCISQVNEKSIVVLGKSYTLWKKELKKYNKEIQNTEDLLEKEDEIYNSDLKQLFIKEQTLVFYDDEDFIADLLLKLEILPFRRCLVGNIIGPHEHGENKEIVYGTRVFSTGTKVMIAPCPWGGFENLVVIGKKRKSEEVIEIVQKYRYIENFRFKRIYNPKVLKLMNNSKYSWWENTIETEDFLKMFAQELNQYNLKNKSEH